MKVYRLERDIAVEGGYDLVVAGGGPAGVSAAISAGRLGARVLLAEATGCLGGMGTSGLVTAFDPMSNGERPLVGGVIREMVETLYERGQLPPQVTPEYWRKNYMCWTPFHPEALKLLLDELVLGAGVEIRYFSRVIDAEVQERTVRGVVLSQVDGYRYVAAKSFIDATGDAILSDLCGVSYREAGRDTPQIMPATLTALCANVDWKVFGKGYKREDWGGSDPDRPKPHYAVIDKAIADGHFTQPDRHVPGLWQISGTLGYMNAGHVFGLNSVNGKSLTDGMILGRKLAREYVDFYRKYVPGCERIEQVATGQLMGVRESRRIVGEYELVFDDYISRRQFPDQIGVFNKFVDIHVYDCSDEEWERFQNEKKVSGRLGPGECFGIPYGILVPKGWKNLWVAGRCASSDVKVHGAIRVMPSAGMMGEAAGAAAVQSARSGQPANGLDTDELTATLRKQGAILE
ncbi:MAG TPA: FAD-dependent oxidoreductase [Spirochaetia bacterium]|nr:FAD-dependent oxidoreductase [Spirochaetia bacterium]